MKRLLIVLIAVLGFASCENIESSPYEFSINAKNGADEKKEVKFNVTPFIVDSLKISKTTLIRMASDAARYADWNVKNKLTYDFNENELVGNMIFLNDDNITISIKGKASNSYGVPGEITSFIYFDIETKEMITDENQFPKVDSHEL